MKDPLETPEDLTRLLDAARQGQAGAEQALWPCVYEYLHRLARHKMAGEPRGHTLQTTALVNEAYLRLVGEETEWRDRRHFYAAAASAMRRILIDRARRVGGLKHGGALQRVPLDDVHIEVKLEPDELIDLDGALDHLADEQPGIHEVVMLRYFAGLNIEEIARVLDVSPRTVDRDWRFARIWLYDRMRGRGGEPD